VILELDSIFVFNKPSEIDFTEIVVCMRTLDGKKGIPLDI
jgi:hypothetical protein